MDTLQINGTERREIDQLLDGFDPRYADLESEEVLQEVAVLAHELPSRIRQTMNGFRMEGLSGALRISGYQIDQERVGPTPGHWKDSPAGVARREELYLIMLNSLLGDPFAWATQQNGRLLHDVLPIRGHENEQLGSSSDTLLTWHTEDAFHPLRGDFLAMLCLRNPCAAVTTVGEVDDLDLPEGIRTVLFEKRFVIRPDKSHQAQNNSVQGTAFDGILEMEREPEPMGVLFGDPAKPYLRADPYFMAVVDGDTEAQHALDQFVKEMDSRLTDVALADGEVIALDNFRVVHGRKPFRARHDGTDRWLKRLNITCDLRKSSGSRVSGTRSIG